MRNRFILIFSSDHKIDFLESCQIFIEIVQASIDSQIKCDNILFQTTTRRLKLTVEETNIFYSATIV